MVLLMSIFALNERLQPHWGRQRQASVAKLDRGWNVGGRLRGPRDTVSVEHNEMNKASCFYVPGQGKAAPDGCRAHSPHLVPPNSPLIWSSGNPSL